MTTSTTTCKEGDVVLVRFPFTNLSQKKLRPAVVISPDAFVLQKGDVVLIALTSQPQTAGFALNRWSMAGLPKATWVKPLVMTLASTEIARKIGSLQSGDWGAVKAAVHSLIAVSFR